jgi:hypothetical protein
MYVKHSDTSLCRRLPKNERNNHALRTPFFQKGNGGFEFIIKTAALARFLFSAVKYQTAVTTVLLFAARKSSVVINPF